eukprot:TRINITY_DN17683_c0_g2_i1.p1 TRINITY_DN17683_c0_g2~~TRINITY_DN17683_c0_g2_i1.p1  ORF type:complete len:176 (-),score=31.35 TRINITY_DN17683_c0_g2_i1:108-635(-)
MLRSRQDSSVSVSPETFSIPPMSPIDIVRPANQQAPLEPSGKWTSMLLNKEILFVKMTGVGLISSTGSRELKLKDDGTFTAQYDSFFTNLIGSGGSSQSKEGFWSVDESSGILYLQVTFCDSASGLNGNSVSTTPSVARTSTCPTDAEQYTLSEGSEVDTIFLDEDEFAISEIDG